MYSAPGAEGASVRLLHDGSPQSPQEPAFEAVVELDSEIYGRDAIFQACYALTGRCFLFLEPSPSAGIRVSLRRCSEEEELGALVGDLLNELVNQRVRIDLFQRTSRLRELIVTQAFTEANFADVEPTPR